MHSAKELLATIKAQGEFCRVNLTTSLRTYDKIIKQYRIDPVCKIALEVYENIVKEYVGLEFGQKHNNAKKNLHLLESEEDSNVDDPQNYGAFFSFAKQKESKNRVLAAVREERLFENIKKDQKINNSEKIKSKKMIREEEKNYVSSFNLHNHEKNLQKTQTILRKQKQKEKGVIEDSRISDNYSQKYATLLQDQKVKFMKQFLLLLSSQKSIKRKMLKNQVAQYYMATKLFQKGFKGISEEFHSSKESQQKVNQHLAFKNENFMQQCFLEWKNRAFMSQIEREQQKQIQMKQQFLRKVLFLESLKKYRKSLIKQKEQIKEKSNQLNKTIVKMKILNVYSIFMTYQQSQREVHQKNKKVQLLIRNKELSIFRLIVKRKILDQKVKQQRLSNTILKKIAANRLFSSLKNQFYLKTVYFRNKEKLPFIEMLLTTIKQNLQRKGYNHEWMSEYESGIKKLDEKFNGYLNNRKLSKAFNALSQVLSDERQKISQIKYSKGKIIFQKLRKNYNVSLDEQGMKIKLIKLRDRIYWKHLKENFTLFIKNTDLSLFKKSEQLKKFTQKAKIHEFLNYFKAYRISKSYYSSKMIDFQTKRLKNFKEQVFDGIKQLLLTDIINKKIVKEFIKYSEKKKAKNIFRCIKEFSLDEKIMKKRFTNLLKLRKQRYHDKLTYRMRVQMYEGRKEKQLEHSFKEQRLKCSMKKNLLGKFIELVQKRVLFKNISVQVSKQYELRFQSKIFYALKFIQRQSQEHRQKEFLIKQKNSKLIKKNTLKIMIERLIQGIMFRNADKIRIKIAKKFSFEQIKSQKKKIQVLQTESIVESRYQIRENEYKQSESQDDQQY